jgi:hypothetical protein
MATKTKTVVKYRTKAPAKRKNKKRRKPLSKGFLSDLVNPTIAMNAAKTVGSGGAGGIAGLAIHKLLPVATGKFMRVIVAGISGYGAAVFGYPNVGAGATGAQVALTFQNGFMGEDMEENEFADDESLSEMPVYLDEEGVPFVMEEDEHSGESYTRYLSEEEYNSIMQ